MSQYSVDTLSLPYIHFVTWFGCTLPCFLLISDESSPFFSPDACVMPILLYECETDWLMTCTDGNVESFQAKRRLKWPKHHSNTAALVVVGMQTVRSTILESCMGFLQKVLNAGSAATGQMWSESPPYGTSGEASWMGETLGCSLRLWGLTYQGASVVEQGIEPPLAGKQLLGAGANTRDRLGADSVPTCELGHQFF